MTRAFPWCAALVAVLVVLAGCGTDPGADPEPAAATEPAATAGEWRTEYWHDVAVDVPADWWYGGGPVDAGRRATACFPEPMVTPQGDRREGRGVTAPGWVGRPISLTDLCAGMDDVPVTVPYLWFDAPLDPGIEQLGDGWTRETREVNGSRVTVATDDAALRRRILGSATGGETCFSELERLDDPTAPAPPVEDERPTVCAYRESGGMARLAYAAHLTPGEAERFVAAVDAAPPAHAVGSRACDLGGASFEWAVVDVAGEAYVVRTGYYGCPHVQHGDRLVRLTPDVVEPWATGGIPAVMFGPTGGKGAMIDSFIGPLG